MRACGLSPALAAPAFLIRRVRPDRDSTPAESELLARRPPPLAAQYLDARAHPRRGSARWRRRPASREGAPISAARQAALRDTLPPMASSGGRDKHQDFDEDEAPKGASGKKRRFTEFECPT